MSQTTMTSKTIVGIFRNDRAAAEAMRSLDAAGFDPDRVHMTEDDPAQAAEIGERTYVREGLIGGALVGLLWVAGFAIWGDLGRDPVGLVVGAIGVVGGRATIGLIFGRTFRHPCPDAGLFAPAFRQRDAS